MRSARVMRITASSTWLSTRVALSVWTSESSGCCCSTQGNSASLAVTPASLLSSENFSVTLPELDQGALIEQRPLHLGVFR